MKNLNHLLLIGALCGLLGGQSVNGGRRLKCHSFEDVRECEGDFCLASLYYVSPTEFYFTQQVCGTAGFIHNSCDDAYPYTDYNVSIPDYFFPRVFHGCCDNGNYCNGNISNLRLPSEYYLYTNKTARRSSDGHKTSTTVVIEDLWMSSSNYPSSSVAVPTPSSSVTERLTTSTPPPATSTTTDSPLPEATDIISGPVGYALIGILSLMLLLCALVSIGFYCYLVTNAISKRRQTYIVNEMSVFYTKSGQVSKDISTPEKHIKIIVPHTEV